MHDLPMTGEEHIISLLGELDTLPNGCVDR
jgi:hypothetical protein